MGSEGTLFVTRQGLKLVKLF